MSSDESPVSNIISPTVSTDPVTHITIPVSIKLDRNNYLTWKSQIEPIVDGFDLTAHLDENFTAPAQKISVSDQLIDNPAFHRWRKQDRLLLGWLRSTISGTILSQYMACQTASSLWS